MLANLSKIISRTDGALDVPGAVNWEVLKAYLHDCSMSQLDAFEWIFTLGVRTGAHHATIAMRSGLKVASALDEEAARRARVILLKQPRGQVVKVVPKTRARKARRPKARK